MLSQTIWGISLALELFLLVRGLRTGLTSKYPVFYSYLLFVVVQSPVRFVANHWYYKTLYAPVFWATEFFGFALGCVVVVEIYRVALKEYPGTAKIARNILWFLFLLAVAKAATVLWADPRIAGTTTPLKVEWALRTVQAFSIAALVTAFAFYSIPFGRNLRGILLGYGIFIAERVICLTFVADAGQDFWFYAYSASYIVALSVWLNYLWSFQPATVALGSPPYSNYDLIAEATHRRLQDARGSLRKTVRP
jgi:hypothetical protein